MTSRKRRYAAIVLALTLVLSFVGMHYNADAGPASDGPAYSVAMIDSDGTVDHRILLKAETKTGANTTPVAGSKVCVAGDADAFVAALTITGTMTGTNPTLSAVLQESINDGRTWRTVHSFAAINATVTPAGGQEYVSFSDALSSTATVRGDCYRVLYTWGGTTPGLNFGVDLLAK